MEEELSKRTEKNIKQTKEKYQMYSSHTIIHEGTFHKYYPARFDEVSPPIYFELMECSLTNL